MPRMGMGITMGGGPDGVSVAVNNFTPMDVSGAVLWLNGSTEITTVDAAVSQPNDVSNVAWTKSNCTTPDTQTILDTNDGAPTSHVIFQAVPNIQVNHAATVTFEAKAGTIGFIRGQDGAGALAVAVNLTTGAVVVGGGSVTVTDVGSGWWRIVIVGTCTNGAYNIGPCAAGGGYAYTGAGTGTVLVRNISVDQKNISIWADQSGGGKDVTQGTAASRPLYLASAVNGFPACFYDNINDQLVAATAADWKFLHDNTGSTICWAFKPTAASTQMIVSTCAQSPVGVAIDFVAGGAGIQYIYQIYNGAGIILNINDAAGVSATAPHVATCTYGGGTAALRVNRSQKSSGSPVGPSAANPTGALTLGGIVGAPTIAPANGSLLEMIAYNRVLNATELAAVESYLSSKFGAP
jgi:hypothetical protein